MNELKATRDGLKIYGKIEYPEGPGPFPVVVFSHGFGASHVYDGGMGSVFTQRGIAFASFDFCGGGPGSQSDGSMLDMSVLTEVADLNAVIDAVHELDAIDAGRVFLMGSSQGGYVSSYVAAQRADDIRGLVLFFPAFCIGDDAARRLEETGLSRSEVPEQTPAMGHVVGKRYVEDALDTDIYGIIGGYPGDVLIAHGTLDELVPYRYSEKAAEVYGPRARLVPVDGMAHGFRSATPECFRKVMDLALDFIEERP